MNSSSCSQGETRTSSCGTPSRPASAGPCARRGRAGIGRAATWAASLNDRARPQSTADLGRAVSPRRSRRARRQVAVVDRRTRSVARRRRVGDRRADVALHLASERRMRRRGDGDRVHHPADARRWCRRSSRAGDARNRDRRGAAMSRSVRRPAGNGGDRDRAASSDRRRRRDRAWRRSAGRSPGRSASTSSRRREQAAISRVALGVEDGSGCAAAGAASKAAAAAEIRSLTHERPPQGHDCARRARTRRPATRLPLFARASMSLGLNAAQRSAHRQPDQSGRAGDDPVPAEGREAAARDDADEPADHDQSDDERDDEADRDAAERRPRRARRGA